MAAVIASVTFLTAQQQAKADYVVGPSLCGQNYYYQGNAEYYYQNWCLYYYAVDLNGHVTSHVDYIWLTTHWWWWNGAHWYDLGWTGYHLVYQCPLTPQGGFIANECGNV